MPHNRLQVEGSASLKEAVVRSFEDYLSNTLETPSASFGDLPPCPFVHAERAKGRIRFEICSIAPSDLGPIRAIIDDFVKSEAYTSLLIIDPLSNASKDEGIALGIALCEELCESGFFAACIHPEDLFQVGDVRTREPAPHTAILVQSRKLLDQGRTILEHTRYYARWSTDNLDYVSYQIGP